MKIRSHYSQCEVWVDEACDAHRTLRHVNGFVAGRWLAAAHETHEDDDDEDE